jgi:hypothetical protein
MSTEHMLQLLQDVEGVVGSFVSNRAGELRARLSPPEFSEAALKRTASRVSRIVRCAELCELDVERCELRLGKNQLLIFCFEGGMLGVLVQPPVSKRALGMAARLAIRELAPLPSDAELEPDEDEVTSQYPSARRSSG